MKVSYAQVFRLKRHVSNCSWGTTLVLSYIHFKPFEFGSEGLGGRVAANSPSLAIIIWYHASSGLVGYDR